LARISGKMPFVKPVAGPFDAEEDRLAPISVVPPKRAALSIPFFINYSGDQ